MVVNPVETVESIPGGVRRLFGRIDMQDREERS